ncbi:MAG: sulfotransferase [Bacteroidota bacterium]
MTPFFILGVPRSGTTLLAELLNGHSALFVPERSHLGRLFMARKMTLNHLQRSGAYDFGASWDEIDRLRLLGGLPARKGNESILEQICSLLEQAANSEGKKYWGDKAPPFLDRMEEINLLFPGARFIHLIRDPRANAVSLRERQSMEIELAMHWWVDLNVKGVQNGVHLGDSQYLRVRFEDLLVEPQLVLQRICGFLRVPYEHQMVSSLAHSKYTNRKGGYVEKELNHDKINSWRKKVNPKIIARLERQAPRFISALGYDLDTHTEEATPLSGYRILWLSFKQNFRLLFNGRRKVMTGRVVEEVRIPFSRRLKKFFSQTARLLFSDTFIKAWKKS